jgi:hypothetical protein
MRLLLLVCCFCVLASHAAAQTPAPFPRPGDPKQTTKVPPAPAAPQTPPQSVQQSGDPTEATLGIAVYPGAQFIASYDAGRGQRYHLFGTNTAFADIVTYYRSILKTRGELVYEAPPIHMFDVGRFREETMAFPPGVSVKDYTWGGAPGYLVPRPGAPVRYRTIIQIVPPPPGTPGR